MVYSSVPVNIIVEDRLAPVEDDESLSVSSAESQDQSTKVPNTELSRPLKSHQKLETDFFEHEENFCAVECERSLHQPIPKSTLGLPVFVDMGYPHENMEEQPVNRTSASLLNFPKPTFRRRSIGRIPMHTRIEMWQHQLGKPFRALSSGIKLPERSTNLGCFGVHVVHNVLTPGPVTVGEECFISTPINTDRRESSNENFSTKSTTVSFDEHLDKDWWNKDKAGCRILASTNIENDSRFLYSTSAWPMEVNTNPCPSEHYNMGQLNQWINDPDGVNVFSTKIHIDREDREDETLITNNSSMDSSMMQEHSEVISLYDLD